MVIVSLPTSPVLRCTSLFFVVVVDLSLSRNFVLLWRADLVFFVPHLPCCLGVGSLVHGVRCLVDFCPWRQSCFLLTVEVSSWGLGYRIALRCGRFGACFLCRAYEGGG